MLTESTRVTGARFCSTLGAVSQRLGCVSPFALHDFVLLRCFDVGKYEVTPGCFVFGVKSPGVTQMFGFHVPSARLTRVIPTSVIFGFSFVSQLGLLAGQTSVLEFARDGASFQGILVSNETGSGTTGLMTVRTNSLLLHGAVVRKTDIAMIFTFMCVGFFVGSQTRMTKPRATKETR